MPGPNAGKRQRPVLPRSPRETPVGERDPFDFTRPPCGFGGRRRFAARALVAYGDPSPPFRISARSGHDRWRLARSACLWRRRSQCGPRPPRLRPKSRDQPRPLARPSTFPAHGRSGGGDAERGPRQAPAASVKAKARSSPRPSRRTRSSLACRPSRQSSKHPEVPQPRAELKPR